MAQLSVGVVFQILDSEAVGGKHAVVVPGIKRLSHSKFVHAPGDWHRNEDVRILQQLQRGWGVVASMGALTQVRVVILMLASERIAAGRRWDEVAVFEALHS